MCDSTKCIELKAGKIRGRTFENVLVILLLAVIAGGVWSAFLRDRFQSITPAVAPNDQPTPAPSAIAETQADSVASVALGKGKGFILPNVRDLLSNGNEIVDGWKRDGYIECRGFLMMPTSQRHAESTFPLSVSIEEPAKKPEPVAKNPPTENVAPKSSETESPLPEPPPQEATEENAVDFSYHGFRGRRWHASSCPGGVCQGGNCTGGR